MKKNSKKYYSIPISNNDIINKIVLENRDNLYKELEKNWTDDEQNLFCHIGAINPLQSYEK